MCSRVNWPSTVILAGIALLLSTVGPMSRVSAAEPEWSLRDYTHTLWTHRDGIPLARVSELTQTTDGYLWFTSEGLVTRFDGVRFVIVPFACDWVTSLEAGDNGSIWAFCRQPRRLFLRSTDGGITEVSLAAVPFAPKEVFRDQRGVLWVYGNGFVRLDPNGQVHVPHPTFTEPINTLLEDRAGVFWMTTESRSIYRIHDTHIERLPSAPQLGIVVAPGGGVYSCEPNMSREVRRFNGAEIATVVRLPPDLLGVAVPQCMGVDAGGRIWAGTQRHGVALIQQGHIEVSVPPGQPGVSVDTVFVDREDTTWVGSSAGLHRFRRPRARLLSTTVPEVPLVPESVFVDSRDDIFIGGARQFLHLNRASGARQVHQIDPYAFAEDGDGHVWVATRSEIGRLQAGVFRPVRDENGAPVPGVWAFARDDAGQLWALARSVGVYQITPGPPRLVFREPAAGRDLMISKRHGVLVSLDGGGVKQFLAGQQRLILDPPSDATNPIVRAIFEDGDSIYMGDAGGLVRWRGGRLTRWTRAHGLPNRGTVQEVTRDRSGRLWVMTDGGLLVISREELDATPDGAPTSLRFAQVGYLDRVVPHPSGPQTSPRTAQDRAGRLYFVTDDSVAVVDPTEVAATPLRPAIVIESVMADNAIIDHAATNPLVTPSLLQIDYTSLSLRSPENIRFRYMLEGYDAAWVEAGQTRRATYGTLAPGTYRFHVTGSGSEGIWNDEGAVFAFEVVPLFYNTWWFRGLMLAALVAAGSGMHHLRVRRLAGQMQIAFDARLAERTRIAGDLHDTLLQTIQGSKMVADDALSRSSDSSGLRAAMEQLSTWLGRATTEGRDAIRIIREPSDASGDLASQLRLAVDDCCRSTSLTGSLTVAGESRILHSSIREDVYRIGYEAIRNACTHSGGERLIVEVTFGQDLTVRIADNGGGMDAQTIQSGKEGHFGVRVMRDRAARIGADFAIARAPGGGTEVVVSVPGGVAYGDR